MQSQTAYELRLLDAGPRKINVVKRIRALSGRDLLSAKTLVDGPGGAVAQFEDDRDAREAARRLEAEGARVEVAEAPRRQDLLAQPPEPEAQADEPAVARRRGWNPFNW